MSLIFWISLFSQKVYRGMLGRNVIFGRVSTSVEMFCDCDGAFPFLVQTINNHRKK